MANEVINKVHDDVPNGIMEIESAYINELEPLVTFNLGVSNDKVEAVRKSFTHWWQHFGKKYKVLSKEKSRKSKKPWQFWKKQN